MTCGYDVYRPDTRRESRESGELTGNTGSAESCRRAVVDEISRVASASHFVQRGSLKLVTFDHFTLYLTQSSTYFHQLEQNVSLRLYEAKHQNLKSKTQTKAAKNRLYRTMFFLMLESGPWAYCPKIVHAAWPY